MNILTAFAGIGGNRRLWDELGSFRITAIENNPAVANEYLKLYPNDTVLIGDAWRYIPNSLDEYDIIWASPPCQTHSKLTKMNKRQKEKKIYDYRLYSLIDYLENNYNGIYIVENVVPSYVAKRKPVKIDRHLFWSNLPLKNDFQLKKMKSFHKQTRDQTHQEYIESITSWIGFKISRNIYLNGNHDPMQIYRNCVHPKLGKYVLEQILNPGLLSYVK